MNRLITMLLIIAATAVYAEEPVEEILVAESKHLVPYRLANPDPRIIGGDIAVVGAWPFMTALVVRGNDASSGQFCGASLIAPQWALTAAHCAQAMIDRGWDYDVIIGIHDLAQGDVQGQRVEVAEHFIHPLYNLDNDLALLKLAVPVNTVEPLALATPAIMDMLPVGFEVTAMGWGATIPDSPFNYPNELHEVLLPIVDQAVCQASYDDDGITITDSMICLGPADGLRDACYGDSGSPVVANVEGTWYEMSLVSFGGSAGCAAADEYGVYMKVTPHLAWIAAKLSNIEVDGFRDFGAIGQNTSHDLVIELTNNNVADAVTFSNPLIVGVSSGLLSITSDDCTGVGVAAGASCSYTITLDASVAGTIEAEFRTEGDVAGTIVPISVVLSGYVLEEVDLANELDNSTLTFWSGGDGIWEADTATSIEGGSSASSPAMVDNQISYLMTEVVGPGQFIFAWSVSSESGWDYLRYYIDGEERGSISGAVGWTDVGFRVPDGTHNISWAYEKDTSVSSRDDNGHVDWIEYSPTADAPVDGVDGLDGADGAQGPPGKKGAGAAGVWFLLFLGATVLATRRHRVSIK